jgi:hypothetical protein
LLSFSVPLTLTAAILLSAILALPSSASAQIVETVGSRALGMGGAFTAVASDSSATWWNPAGPAAGPFFDMAMSRASTRNGPSPAIRDSDGSSFALTIPPIGFGYYRLRITDIRRSPTTEDGTGGREDRGVGPPTRSLSATQLGVTLVHSLISGVHAGTTLKYVRGSVDAADSEGSADLDVGLLTVTGSLRLGAVVRNLRAVEIDDPLSPGDPMRLPRQTRVGAAFSPENVTGVPLTIAVDADVRIYSVGGADRRAVAVGGEHWLASRRVGVRAGARFNTVGARERSATAGLTLSVRTGLFIDGHVVRGGAADERGWGVAGRVSF